MFNTQSEMNQKQFGLCSSQTACPLALLLVFGDEKKMETGVGLSHKPH